MGGSGIGPSEGIDPSVGGLVWVRRRNGSWWPGRILGSDEVPENSLSMPRLGTPVKLLGREDASVDWYNLERSKRVKAFRCGEYDDCIEKAKAVASHPSKKDAKYARREDAIIHALELESARLGKEHPHFSDRPDTCGEHPRVDESPSSFHTNRESNDYIDGNLSSCDLLVLDLSCSTEESEDSIQEESRTGLSFVKSDLVDVAKEGARRWRTPNDSEDDGTEGARRMKGLEDLGLGMGSSLKRKRSLVDHVHEFLKKKNRRRALTKVLESTPRLPVRVYASSSPNESCFLGALDCRVSGLESYELKKNHSLVINKSGSMTVSCENGISLNTSKHFNNTSVICKLKENEAGCITLENDSLEGLFHVPLVTQGFSKIVSADSQKARIGAAAESSQSRQVEKPSLGDEVHNESGSTSTGAAYIHYISQSIDKGASQWQLKGKRNSRSRKMDADIEAVAGVDGDSFLVGSNRKADFNRLCGTLMTESYSCNSNNMPPAETQVEISHRWSWSTWKDSSARGSTPELMVPQRSLPYRQSRFMLNPKYDTPEFSLRHHISSSGLYDVPVEAKGSYRPQCVPYISLMSRLNGRPVIGHPLAIEKLNGGMYNDQIRMVKCHGRSWELDTSDYRDVDMVYGKRPRGIAMSKRNHLQARSSPTKSPRSRQNALLSKKIRKLSSLTSSRRGKEKRQPVVEKLKCPCIACIPLNVVFSRIMTAMNSST
ncbi:uncharacterized protein At1g51745-like [Primulina huaijiensis]|uniref:uncharacterized protein At1g51745-like n=1 Tax=Primulina huaijiensis TaxID=1492673 RepID=UPI003CC70665